MRRLPAFLLLLVACSAATGQGRLESVRDKVQAEPSSEQKDKKEEDCCHCSCDEDDSDSLFGELFRECFLAVVSAPFTIPHHAMNDSFDRWGYFPSHPYKNHNGYLMQEPLEPEAQKQARTWAGRIAIENGNDFNGLNRFNFHLLMETSSRLGFQTRWNFLEETLSGFRSDELILGSTEVIFRFAQSPGIQMYSGIGFRTLIDNAQSCWGVNFTYGADIFPGDPLIVSLLFDAGTLGSAVVYRLRGTLGVAFDRLEIFAGIDYLNISGVPIWGPLLGARLWY